MERFVGQLYAENEFFKKSVVYLGDQIERAEGEKRQEVMYTLIERNQDLPVRGACKCLSVSCSGYYNWRRSSPRHFQQEMHRMGVRQEHRHEINSESSPPSIKGEMEQ